MANKITTVLDLDASRFGRGIKQATNDVKQADGFFNKVKVGWQGAIAAFAASPSAIGTASAAVGLFAAQSISAASDLEESINAVNVTFGESADEILEFGENAAKSVGLANSEFNQLATPLGSILKNTGLGMDEVADKTITLATRAADMASVFNKDVSVALGAIQAGLRGELDPLEQFGVKLSAAAVEQRALANTGKESVRQLTEQEKALARIDIILEQTNQTAGDFAETSDSLANQTKRLKAEYKDLQAQVGQELIPVLSDLAGALIELKDLQEQIPGPVSLFDLGTVDLSGRFGRDAGAAADLAKAMRDGELAGGAFAAVIQSMLPEINEAGNVVRQLADEVEQLPPRWSAASITMDAASGNFAELTSEADRNREAIDDTTESVNKFEDGLQKAGDQVNFLTSELNKLDEDLRTVELLSDIDEQFQNIAESADDQEGEILRLVDLVKEYVRTLDGLSKEKVTEIVTVLRSGDVDRIRALYEELTKDLYVNISVVPKQSAFESLNAVFSGGAAPSAPSFQGVSSPAPVDLSTKIYNFPVGSTPTTQYIDGQTDLRRNGAR